jgi:hypothetical protein
MRYIITESQYRLLTEETSGVDDFIGQMVEKYPEVEGYSNQIKSFIENSGCHKIEVASFKYPAMGLALHNGVLFNKMIFYQTLPKFLFVLFHEIAHQYQYKKYGAEKMYEFYLGDLDVNDTAESMKKIEIIADEFALRKVREFAKIGLIDVKDSNLPAVYKTIPINHFVRLITQSRDEIKRKGITDFDGVSETFYNMVKVNI